MAKVLCFLQFGLILEGAVSFLPIHQGLHRMQQNRVGIRAVSTVSRESPLKLQLASVASSTTLPPITEDHLEQLAKNNYVVIPNFYLTTCRKV